MRTRKNKLISLLKIGVLLFGISLLLVNCEKETTFLQEIHNSEKSNFSVNYVSIENILSLNTLFNSGKNSPFENYCCC